MKITRMLGVLFGAALMLAGCVYDDGYYGSYQRGGTYREGYYYPPHDCTYYGDCDAYRR